MIMNVFFTKKYSGIKTIGLMNIERNLDNQSSQVTKSVLQDSADAAY